MGSAGEKFWNFDQYYVYFQKNFHIFLPHFGEARTSRERESDEEDRPQKGRVVRKMLKILKQKFT